MTRKLRLKRLLNLGQCDWRLQWSLKKAYWKCSWNNTKISIKNPIVTTLYHWKIHSSSSRTGNHCGNSFTTLKANILHAYLNSRREWIHENNIKNFQKQKLSNIRHHTKPHFRNGRAFHLLRIQPFLRVKLHSTNNEVSQITGHLNNYLLCYVTSF